MVEKVLLVYFDTNIFGDLLDPLNQIAAQWLNIIKAKISENRIRIVPSFETLQEILIVPEDKDGLSEQRQKLYREIVDWLYLLKPVNEIFRDDILSFARNGNQDIPFVRPNHKMWDYIIPIRFDRITLPIENLISKIADFNRRFVERLLMRPVFKKAKDIRRIIRSPNSNAEMQWMYLWQPGNVAHIMAKDYAVILNVLKECEKQGLDKLLKLPTIRLHIGYILHWWYMRIIHKTTNIEISSTMDSRHAICAGAIGNIVTNDGKLRATIKHIPDHNVNVWSLEEFVTCISAPGANLV